MPTHVLTKEQNDIANLHKNGMLIVKGIAGSGKTTVGIHRFKYIVNNLAFEGDKIAYLTYNKTLISYINQLVKNEDFNFSDDGQGTLEFVTKTNYQQHIGTVSKLMIDYYMSYVKMNDIYIDSLDKDDERIFYLKKGIKEIVHETGNSNINIFKSENYKFLLEEIDWIRTCRIETEKEYQVVERKGRVKSSNEGGRRLAIKSDVRKYIFKLSRKYIKLLWNDRKADFILKEMIALDQIKNNPIINYDHIIVDECQDLSRIQLDFLKHLLKEKSNSTATLLFDVSQSIYPNSWLSPNRPLSSLGIISNKGNTKTLKKNWRTTAEIQRAALSLIENEQDIKIEQNIEIINRSNILPIYYKASSPDEHDKFIIETIKSKINTFNKKDVAITSRTRSGLNNIKKLLDYHGIENEVINKETTDFNQEKVRLYTMHSIKGLECDVVIMANLNDGYLPYLENLENEQALLRERKLMYVAMTRAKYQLIMVSSTDHPTRFIKDIDPLLLNECDANSIVLDPKQRHPRLAKEYMLFEKLLEDISVFKEASESGLGVEERRKRYHELFKELVFAEKELAKILDTVQIGSIDDFTLRDIKKQVIENLEYNNFSKYAKEQLEGNEIYDTSKKLMLQNVKNQYRQLNPKERDWLAEILVRFQDLESIQKPRYIYIDMFIILEQCIRKKFKLDNSEGQIYPLSKIVRHDMNIENWRKTRQKILESKIIDTRNSLSHDIYSVSKEQLLEFKKMLLDDGLLLSVLKSEVK